MTASRAYPCASDQCEADASDVAWYRQKIETWTEWFSADQHSIWNQLAGMMWNDTVFRALNESRRLAHASGEQRASMNSVICGLLDEGYVATQASSIRKLIEPEQRQASRQVISLRRALDDMRASRDRLTREVFVCFDGAPYDPDAAHADYLTANANAAGFTGVPTNGPGAFGASRRAHAKFDKLSGVEPKNRSRSDLIAGSYFDKHEATLSASKAREIADYCNKFIAHAADSASRQTVQTQAVSLRLFEDCHRRLYNIAFALYIDILNDAEHSLAVISHRHPCDNLDEIWSSSDEVKELYKFYEERESFIDSWRADYS